MSESDRDLPSYYPVKESQSDQIYLILSRYRESIRPLFTSIWSNLPLYYPVIESQSDPDLPLYHPVKGRVNQTQFTFMLSR